MLGPSSTLAACGSSGSKILFMDQKQELKLQNSPAFDFPVFSFRIGIVPWDENHHFSPPKKKRDDFFGVTFFFISHGVEQAISEAKTYLSYSARIGKCSRQILP